MHFVLATLLTVALLALTIGPIMGAGVVSAWTLLPNNPWFGWFGWLSWLFPQFPYPI